MGIYPQEYVIEIIVNKLHKELHKQVSHEVANVKGTLRWMTLYGAEVPIRKLKIRKNIFRVEENSKSHFD